MAEISRPRLCIENYCLYIALCSVKQLLTATKAGSIVCFESGGGPRRGDLQRGGPEADAAPVKSHKSSPWFSVEGLRSRQRARGTGLCARAHTQR